MIEKSVKRCAFNGSSGINLFFNVILSDLTEIGISGRTTLSLSAWTLSAGSLSVRTADLLCPFGQDILFILFRCGCGGLSSKKGISFRYTDYSVLTVNRQFQIFSSPRRNDLLQNRSQPERTDRNLSCSSAGRRSLRSPPETLQSCGEQAQKVPASAASIRK